MSSDSRPAMGNNMPASLETADFTTRTLMAILTAQADRAELDQQIAVLIRSLADAHDVPASYPPN